MNWTTLIIKNPTNYCRRIVNNVYPSSKRLEKLLEDVKEDGLEFTMKLNDNIVNPTLTELVNLLEEQLKEVKLKESQRSKAKAQALREYLELLEGDELKKAVQDVKKRFAHTGYVCKYLKEVVEQYS